MELDELHTRVWRGRIAPASRPVIASGFADLDRYLPGGGWPTGALIEILVDGYGIGELGLLMPALATLTQHDPVKSPKWIAWVGPPFVPYAPAFEQHRVSVERLLMIHPGDGHKNRLWSIEQVIRSGSSAGVLAWIVSAEDVILRRLQLAAEDQNCWTVLFRPLAARQQRSPAALRLSLSSQTAAAMRIEILKCRGGRPGVIDIAQPVVAHAPNALPSQVG